MNTQSRLSQKRTRETELIQLQKLQEEKTTAIEHTLVSGDKRTLQLRPRMRLQHYYAFHDVQEDKEKELGYTPEQELAILDWLQESSVSEKVVFCPRETWEHTWFAAMPFPNVHDYGSIEYIFFTLFFKTERNMEVFKTSQMVDGKRTWSDGHRTSLHWMFQYHGEYETWGVDFKYYNTLFEPESKKHRTLMAKYIPKHLIFDASGCDSLEDIFKLVDKIPGFREFEESKDYAEFPFQPCSFFLMLHHILLGTDEIEEIETALQVDYSDMVLGDSMYFAERNILNLFDGTLIVNKENFVKVILSLMYFFHHTKAFWEELHQKIIEYDAIPEYKESWAFTFMEKHLKKLSELDPEVHTIKVLFEAVF